MADDSSLFHGWHVAFDDVKVRSADRGADQLDHRISRLLDFGLGAVFEGNLALAVEYEGFHCRDGGKVETVQSSW